MFLVACDCALEEHDQGTPVLITCPTLELMDTVIDTMPDNITTIYMGTEAVGISFDHQIDTTENSTNETMSLINSLIPA